MTEFVNYSTTSFWNGIKVFMTSHRRQCVERIMTQNFIEIKFYALWYQISKVKLDLRYKNQSF